MNPTPEPEITIQHAAAELVALALKVRADWSERDVQGALAHARTVGITWPQAVVELARLMVDADAKPADLVPDSRDPLALTRRPRPHGPPPEWFEAVRNELFPTEEDR